MKFSARPSTDPGEVTGLSSLGKRITRRVFDLTALTLICMGLLTIAVRLTTWWRAGGVTQEGTAGALGLHSDAVLPWGWGEHGAWLGFGEANWSARHIPLWGSADEVRQRLISECQRQLRDSNLNDIWQHLDELAVGEQRLLDQLEQLTPVFRDRTGYWRIYALDGPLLAVFAVAQRPGSLRPSTLNESTGTDAGASTTGDPLDLQEAGEECPRQTSQAASPLEPPPVARRVVCWGLALPGGSVSFVTNDTNANESPESQPLWSGWIIDPSGRGDLRLSVGPVLPMLPGAVRTLSLRDTRAGGLDTLHGPGDLAAWRAFYERWLKERGAEEFSWSITPGRSEATVVLSDRGRRWRLDFYLAESHGAEGGPTVECLVNLLSIWSD